MAPVSVIAIYPIVRYLSIILNSLHNGGLKKIVSILCVIIITSLCLARFAHEVVYIDRVCPWFSIHAGCTRYPIRNLLQEEYLKPFEGKQFIFWDCYYPLDNPGFGLKQMVRTIEFKRWFPNTRIVRSKKIDAAIDVLSAMGDNDVFVMLCGFVAVREYRSICEYINVYKDRFIIHEIPAPERVRDKRSQFVLIQKKHTK